MKYTDKTVRPKTNSTEQHTKTKTTKNNNNRQHKTKNANDKKH